MGKACSSLISTLRVPQKRQSPKIDDMGLVWIAPGHRQALLIAGDGSIASDPLGGRPHAFTRLLEKAEVRQIRIHDLRRTFASLLIQQRIRAYAKEQLGHGRTYRLLNCCGCAWVASGCLGEFERRVGD